ncbi:hypothetical protein M0802_014117 [Mischocyttarus mexicanus]|nr:hypothetical protein M0802_014117 [Mischocyttarus mexicanus]
MKNKLLTTGKVLLFNPDQKYCRKFVFLSTKTQHNYLTQLKEGKRKQTVRDVNYIELTVCLTCLLYLVNEQK